MVWPWLAFGLLLVASELFLPGLVAGPTGVAALGAALLAYWGLPAWAQLLAWVLLSIALILLSRRLVPKGPAQLEDILKESREARAVTAIPPGKQGRVRRGWCLARLLGDWFCRLAYEQQQSPLCPAKP
jgi:membrane protein implicated in regulation of membrane protease activity